MFFKKRVILGTCIWLLNGMLIASLYIKKEPLCSVYTQQEWYSGKRKVYLFAGDRKRFSCCTGAAWTQGNRFLITANFQAGCICCYKYQQNCSDFILQQIVADSEKVSLIGSDNIALSSDDTLLAVTVNHALQVNVYAVDPESCFINPVPFILKPKNIRPHGVAFSHNGYLAYTSIDKFRSKVIVEALEKKINNVVASKTVCELKNNYYPLLPKGIDFTKDDEFIVICYAQRIINSIEKNAQSLIAIHKFDKNTGIIATNPTCVYKNADEFSSAETIKFYKDSYVILSDQVNDKIVFFGFDKAKGVITQKLAVLDNTTSAISFPHGLAVSKDDNYLVVTNYGTDNFSLYSLLPDNGQFFA